MSEIRLLALAPAPLAVPSVPVAQGLTPGDPGKPAAVLGVRLQGKGRHAAFTFFEILVSTIFLMVALVFLFSVFTASNTGTLDSYRETLAYTLAGEGLEWVSGLGYERLAGMLAQSGNDLERRLGLGSFVPVRDLKRDDYSDIKYPEDYQLFERKIELTHFPADSLMKVTVTVQPRSQGLIRRQAVVLQRLVGLEYD